MSKTKVALCIGHQEDNQGARGSEGIGEWEYNKILIDSLMSEIDKIDNLEVQVFMRDKTIKGYTRQMRELHSRLDKWGSDISIEFHFNAHSNPKVTGHEVLYCSAGGKEIAELMNSKFNEIGNKNRGLKKVTQEDRGGGFCCLGKSKAIIIEPFFAVEQYKYYHGGSGYPLLKKAILKFLWAI